MTNREKVIATLKHQQSETTPSAFEVTRGFVENYQKLRPCADVERDLNSHVMFGRYKKQTWISDNIYEDIFGVRWRLGEDGGDIGTPINTLVTLDNVEEYQFPEIDQPLLQKGLDAMKQDTENFRMFRMTYSMYERCWSLMGMQELLMNMAMEEDDVERLFERVCEYELKLLDAVLDNDFEGVFFGDDYGQQTGLIMGPRLFREYIKPQMKKMFDKVHSKGKYVILHSCGNIESILPDLIEIGLDAYNTVQPEIYDLAKIKREFGKNLTFWGAMSTQQFLPMATPEEVYKKSIETIRTLGKDGGYIFSPTHAITPDVPVENILAMKKAAEECKW